MKPEINKNRVLKFFVISGTFLFVGIAGIEAGLKHDWRMAGIILVVGAIAMPLAWFRGRNFSRALREARERREKSADRDSDAPCGAPLSHH